MLRSNRLSASSPPLGENASRSSPRAGRRCQGGRALRPPGAKTSRPVPTCQTATLAKCCRWGVSANRPGLVIVASGEEPAVGGERHRLDSVGRPGQRRQAGERRTSRGGPSMLHSCTSPECPPTASSSPGGDQASAVMTRLAGAIANDASLVRNARENSHRRRSQRHGEPRAVGGQRQRRRRGSERGTAWRRRAERRSGAEPTCTGQVPLQQGAVARRRVQGRPVGADRGTRDLPGRAWPNLLGLAVRGSQTITVSSSPTLTTVRPSAALSMLATAPSCPSAPGRALPVTVSMNETEPPRDPITTTRPSG